MDIQTAKTQAYALEYWDAGLVPIPVRLDGSKKSSLESWKLYQTVRPERELVKRWFSRPVGIAVIMGRISGGAECLDFDDPEPFSPIWSRLPADLQGRLAIYETPRGGWHMIYRCTEIFGNAELAYHPDGKKRIETRGDGGYMVVEGSPLSVHPSGLPYCHYMGRRLETLGEITPQERRRLWQLCASYDLSKKPTPAQKLGRMLAEQEYRAMNPVKIANIEQVSAYLAKMDPAIQGNDGSKACFRVACKLVGHFGLSREAALQLMTADYNPRCSPPWSQRELEHKVDDAMRRTGTALA